MNTDLQANFLQLLRLGIGTSKNAKISKDVDWARLKTLADEQGLSAVILDGIDKLNTNLSNSTNILPLELKLEWIGEVLQNYEQRYASYRNAIGSLAGFYNEHEFKMMVLKGYACSLNWPKPEHRPCGDIDIWQFGQQKEADEALEHEKGISIDNSHPRHTVYEWQGFTVENHYDFLNVHHHISNVKLEAILKELGQDDSHSVELIGEKVYLPSPNLHALFLLRHSMSHFASTSVSLRLLLDWALFVEKYGKDVDWEWLIGVIDVFGMKSLFNIFNAICIEDLGFNVNTFPFEQYDPLLKERVLRDCLSPEFSEVEKGGFCRRAIYKYRRWRANAWKHELCYKESMWSAFWSGVWGHLLKPSSI